MVQAMRHQLKCFRVSQAMRQQLEGFMLFDEREGTINWSRLSYMCRLGLTAVATDQEYVPLPRSRQSDEGTTEIVEVFSGHA